MMALQLIGGRWPKRWAPQNAGTFNQESFASWWPRVEADLGHLDPRVAEQWIHRHWHLSPYFGFDVKRARSELRRLSTATIMDAVRTVDDRQPSEIADPDKIYAMFNPKGMAAFEPALTMNTTGTWNMPVLVVESDHGFVYNREQFPDAHFWLIEGHQRQRYLRALAYKGKAAPEHEVLILAVS